MEGAGAVHAENAALRWLADRRPDGAGGTSCRRLDRQPVGVDGGPSPWRRRRGGAAREPRSVLSRGPTSSIGSALELLDLEPFLIPDDDRRFRPPRSIRCDAQRYRVARRAGRGGRHRGDDQHRLGRRPGRGRDPARRAWFHVDVVHGGGVCSTSRRHPSTVSTLTRSPNDPHKWLFAPTTGRRGAVPIWRRPDGPSPSTPSTSRRSTTGSGTSDYAPQFLSRRACGPLFWFSLVVHGTGCFHAAAVDRTDGGRVRRGSGSAGAPGLVMVQELPVPWSVGPGGPRSATAPPRTAGPRPGGLVVPTTWRGETVLRLCVVNPVTTPDDVTAVLPMPP